MIFRRGGLWLLGLSCAVTLGACEGISDEVGSMNEGGGGGQGPECEAGATRPAEDDCNTCTCDDEGNWNCSAIACNECVPGQTKPGENDCSTCSCGPDGHWDCQVVECPECTAGETRAAGDGCNTCTCFDGTWSCTMKFCGGLVCNPGFADCDADTGNGCETHVEASVENCGRCGNHCAIAGAYAACEAGVCVLDRCDPPYADCNGDPADGCESPVSTNGCDSRCEAPSMLTEPVRAEGRCDCPEGTACVRGSTADENESSEYCFPIPEGCTGGFASCSCMTDCACPAGSRTTCFDEMSVGGMIINCAGYP